jgi:alcohol dehydrogenase (NADP+)
MSSLAVNHLLPLNNGKAIHALGFGTFDVHGDAIKAAVKAGFRHFDGASFYGNEKEIGAALKEVFANEAEYGVKRSDLFITSKVWNTDHAPENVAISCRRSLADLGLDYLDLLLIHWPVAWRNDGPGVPFPHNELGGVHEEPIPLEVTYAAMEKLVDEGLVRSIGVSNFNAAQLRSLIAQCRIKPVCNQVEMGVTLPQVALRKVHEELGIVTVAYCPMGINPMGGTQGKGPIEDPAIIALAEREGRAPADMILRYVIQLGCCPLSRSNSPVRIAANAKISMAPLSEATMAALAEYGAAHATRTCNPDTFTAARVRFFPDNFSA